MDMKKVALQFERVVLKIKINFQKRMNRIVNSFYLFINCINDKYPFYMAASYICHLADRSVDRFYNYTLFSALDQIHCAAM